MRKISCKTATVGPVTSELAIFLTRGTELQALILHPHLNRQNIMQLSNLLLSALSKGSFTIFACPRRNAAGFSYLLSIKTLGVLCSGFALRNLCL